ncbi:DNA-binding response regulator, NarL/FixJ family, contains REC and HTH domains [Salinimicrobium catena]|uniref:DNA-binding response regulator, NarL/FixJ family, contains REC and HTH domains n=2 Tax=Salinimicrobium catena TaxID=390640 RepID=A0A1H5L8P8_9FLAO|nr:DNA-binding response regulator, NarL/FixJ family, contains REC and HTH domains [Salinimicrobium catena]SEE72558.1 DNA-binding response regulator, NarL/FixJ family, contains REC and HTH domains [Salinimicrobium catena]
MIEDEIIIAESLRLFLKKNNYEATIATNGAKAIETLQNENFSGVICDINLQEKRNGIEIIQNYHDLNRHGPVIFLTAYSNPQVMEEAEEVSPYAYIIKPFNNQQLLTTLNLAIKNQFTLSPSSTDTSLAEQLSRREVEILQLLATGKTNKIIGSELFISKHTVDTHVKNIKEKLNLNKKGELIRFVLANRLA